MSTRPTPDRCATSPRCRQPLTLMITNGSWTSMVCEKHAGLLLARLLNPTGTKHGELSVDVRPYGDWSER